MGCCHRQLLAADSIPNAYKEYIEWLAGQIHALGKAPVVDPVLLETYGQKLDEAVQKGIDIAIGMEQADPATIFALRHNAWQFSGAKSYSQLLSFSRALVDSRGNIASLADFRQSVQNISGTHMQWLRTEYDTAIAGGQMASLWGQIEEDADLLPLLKFEVVLDARTSDICQSLDGVVRHYTDPIFNKYYPPNHFGCRTTIRRLRQDEEPITPDDRLRLPEIPKLFQVNLGRQGLVFPDDHPYYKHMPPAVKKEYEKHFPNLE